MFKKIFIIILVLFNLVAFAYLVSPTPTLPDLPQSVKSNLPGDTVQIPNVSAYFTNLSRSEVMNFYRSQYQGLFRVHINYPVEKARNVIVDTIPTYYFEEFSLPFKESLYVNGYEWENDPFLKPEKRIKAKLIYKDVEYKAKITIRTFPTPLWQRFLAFYGTEFGLIAIIYLYRRFFFTK